MQSYDDMSREELLKRLQYADERITELSEQAHRSFSKHWDAGDKETATERSSEAYAYDLALAVIRGLEG
jgi:hypothetical protein